MTAAVQDQLYDAGKESIVAEETSNSTYEKIALAGDTYEGNSSGFQEVLKDTEKRIKEEFSLKNMPNPWRSAKSVVLTALNLGIHLLDDNGKILGKTALQNRIKMEKNILTIMYPLDLNSFVNMIITSMTPSATASYTYTDVKKALLAALK